MDKIIKSSGYCSDGCQWNFCSFYSHGDEPIKEVIDNKFLTRHVVRCKLFSDVEIVHGSLHCCNKIYGMNYEGRV